MSEDWRALGLAAVLEEWSRALAAVEACRALLRGLESVPAPVTREVLARYVQAQRRLGELEAILVRCDAANPYREAYDARA